MDRIAPTPRNRVLGLLADTLAELEEKAKSVRQPNPLMMVPSLLGGQTPQTAILNLLGVPALQKTVERMSYGEPLTTGSGMTTRPRQETTEAALLAAGIAGPAAKAGEKAAMAVGKAGERLAERAVPAVMERGGLPAEMMQAMGQGGRSYVITPASAASQSGAVRATKGLPVGMGIKNVGKVDDLSYRGSHTAPGPDFGAPLYDLTGGGQMYPADVYSAKAAQYYGTGFPKADREAFALAQRVRGNPDAEVTMYRAVPKDENITSINAGDWVTLSKDYAKTHGESALRGDYKILSQKVKAKDLWTNADSIHEFGYQPSKNLSQAPQEEALRLAQQRAALPVEQGGLGLPKDNTPMDRARAMGFNTLGYRGSSAHETTHAKPMWWSEDPDYASAYAAHTVRPPKGQPDPYAGNVMPLLVKIGNEKKFEKFNAGGVPDPSEVFKGFNEGVETGLRRYTNHPNLGDMSGKIWEALTIPKNVRSRFAAFDPKRINDPDLLASLAAFGVGLPVLGLLAEEE